MIVHDIIGVVKDLYPILEMWGKALEQMRFKYDFNNNF